MNLEPYTEYRISMSSGTKIGEGPTSLPLLFTTGEDGKFDNTLKKKNLLFSFRFYLQIPVPSAPHSVSCTALNENEVNITWNEPKDRNGVIAGYKIVIPNLRTEDVEIVVEVNFPKQHLLVEDLLPFEKYRFEVRAFTKIGIGEVTYCNATTEEGCKCSWS